MLFHRKPEELAGIAEPLADLVETLDDIFELRPFPAECLGALRLVPDVGLFEFAPNLDQALGLAIVVKDTSSTRRRVR